MGSLHACWPCGGISNSQKEKVGDKESQSRGASRRWLMEVLPFSHCLQNLGYSIWGARKAHCSHYLKVKGEAHCETVTFIAILISFLGVLRLKVRDMAVVLDPLGRV